MPDRASATAVARWALFAALGLALAACSARDTASFLAAGAPGPKPATSNEGFTKSAYCPPLQVRGGTEAMTIYERGHDNEPAYIRFLASITKTARECHLQGNTLVMKIGVAGRVVAGPKGGPGSLTLPIRIAVAKQIGGERPLYSQLFKIPVTVGPPDFSGAYSQVFDQVTFQVAPDDRDLLAYVGFDEGTRK